MASSPFVLFLCSPAQSTPHARFGVIFYHRQDKIDTRFLSILSLSISLTRSFNPFCLSLALSHTPPNNDDHARSVQWKKISSTLHRNRLARAHTSPDYCDDDPTRTHTHTFEKKGSSVYYGALVCLCAWAATETTTTMSIVRSKKKTLYCLFYWSWRAWKSRIKSHDRGE